MCKYDAGYSVNSVDVKTQAFVATGGLTSLVRGSLDNSCNIRRYPICSMTLVIGYQCVYKTSFLHEHRGPSILRGCVTL